ncbi:Uncharacterised protein [Segatella copri]|nr:Uncharacterised protein [Segatella copri]
MGSSQDGFHFRTIRHTIQDCINDTLVCILSMSIHHRDERQCQ